MSIEALSQGRPFEFAWVIQEVLFVFGILLGGTTLVAKQYSRNLKLMFDLQMKAFDAVEKGKYDSFVQVVSRDEQRSTIGWRRSPGPGWPTSEIVN